MRFSPDIRPGLAGGIHVPEQGRDSLPQDRRFVIGQRPRVPAQRR
jgi:hypothetical protein